MNVLLVDDRVIAAQGMKIYFETNYSDIHCEVQTKEEFVIEAQSTIHVDVIILNLAFPVSADLTLLKKMSAHMDGVMLIYSNKSKIETYFNAIMNIGVHGFICEDTSLDSIYYSIKCAIQGNMVLPDSFLTKLRKPELNIKVMDKYNKTKDIFLSEREQDVFYYLNEGLTNKEMAEKLAFSQRSIEYVLTNIFKKLNVKTRTEALVKANKYLLSNGTHM